MIRFFGKINWFYSWWKETLLSTLPDSWYRYLTDIGNNVELVIVHQGDTLFVQTDKGKIVESISAGTDDEEASGYISTNEKDLSIGNFKIDGVQPQDAILGANTTEIDFDISTGETSHTFEAPDINLLDSNPDFANSSSDEPVTDRSVPNVFPLNIPKEEEITLVIEDGDQTARLLEMNPESDESTFIIRGDQGNLMQGGEPAKDKRENTLLFCSDGGRIRQVEQDLPISDIDHLKISEDITELVTEVESSDDTVYELVAALLKKYQGKKKCLYLLPQNKLFILTLTYPIEAVLNIETVLKYDLEKYIPLTFDEVRYFYALNVDAKNDKVEVEIAVIKANEFDLMSHSLGPYIGKGLYCSTQQFFEKYGNKINFLEDKKEKTWKSWLNFSNIHLTVNWALLIAMLILPVHLYQNKIDQLSSGSPNELDRVKNIMSSINAINSKMKLDSELSDRISRSPRAIVILSILSDSINNQAWISRFNLKNNEIKIKGEASSATLVSDDLNKTGLFESIKFVSSINKNPRSGKETFELLLKLKAGA